jgi:dTDP-4-amino-4,6-dideoxygalactose transaminase
MNRRHFLASSGVAVTASANPVSRPALLGGAPVRGKGWNKWPVFDETEEKAVLDVLRSGKWYRGSGAMVRKFEAQYAALTGAKYCLATANGTSALLASLGALGVGPGDEVILPPYTFVATVNVILAHHALPVFVDSDIETFQIDHRKIESAITANTRLIMPVHLGGGSVDLDAILALADKRNLPVIEDACQSHLAEWRGAKVGTYGLAGCFSFQASKNLNSGEGGAVLTSDADFLDRASEFHSNSSSQHAARRRSGYQSNGLNLRMPEFQAALLMAQMTRLEKQSKTRETNAQYLTKMLGEIPGIRPAAMYAGNTRNAYHLYMFRYDASRFANLPRAKFLKALAAEGIPASPGYTPLNQQPLVQGIADSRAYQRIYGEAELKRWRERNLCPQNDKLCEEAVWLTQTMLLGPREDMEQIAEGIRKIQRHAGDLA